MESNTSPGPAQRHDRRSLALLVGLLAVVAAAAAYAVSRHTPVAHGHGAAPAARTAGTAARPGLGTPRRSASPREAAGLRLATAQAGSLPAAVQDAAAATLPGGGALLLGGLTAADTSSNAIVHVDRAGGRLRARLLGHLPRALHDSAAVRLGRFVYLFGGGDGTAQLAEILRVDPATGAVTAAGRLPAPSSDQAAAALDGTAYVVGGYTGTRWLDTVVAWRPGTPARVVARLPFALRYAAVAAAGGRIVVAGGSLVSGGAARTVLLVDPATGRVRQGGRLPQPLTHAAAAALGNAVVVAGGRGDSRARRSAALLVVDPASGRVARAGKLPTALSDMALVPGAGGLIAAGGTGERGASAALQWLRPRAAAARPAGTARATAATRPGSSGAAVRRPDVYAAAGAGALSGAARLALPRIYVPNSRSDTVDVIDPASNRIVGHFPVGGLPQHVTPSWDLRTLYVLNDAGNSLTPVDPRTARPGRPIPVADPYNMYFTPDGRYAIVVAERLHRLDFRDPHTFALRRSLHVPCSGVDHMDFSADGRTAVASCEFSGMLLRLDVRRLRLLGTLTLPDGSGGMPQDVKLSPDGRTYWVADMVANGLWKVDAQQFRVVGFLRTGKGVHGLYPSRDARLLYATNRGAGSVSVISFTTGRILRTWHIPGGGSPDMGGVSADGKVLWVSGRYNGVVYAISTHDGHLLARIHVGAGPHGLCVWPQPGRYSLGHTGILR